MSSDPQTTVPSPHPRGRIGRDKTGLAESFDRAASSYNLLASLNPGYRRHLEWSAKRLELGPGPEVRVLDLCCGTGLSTLPLVQAYPQAEIVALDNSPGMLDVAKRNQRLAGVRFVAGDAMDPASAGVSGTFDGILMAYGIRNVPDADLCLQRLWRLLAPGGVICFHEYSVADSQQSRFVWNVVTCSVVIPLGLLLSGSSSIFRYLRRSVLEFDGAERFAQRLRDAGFVAVERLPMDGWQRGILHTFRARRPAR